MVPDTKAYEEGITIAALPVTVAILFLAAYWTRKENNIGTSFTIFLYIAGLAYFFFKLVRIYDGPPDRVQDYYYARRSLTTFAVMSLILLFITIVYAGICTANYGKGLKPHVDSQSSRWGRRRGGGEELSKLYSTDASSVPLASPRQNQRMIIE